MRIEWVFIEIFTIFVENLAVLYFIHSRFASVYRTWLPQVVIWAVTSLVGILTVFVGISFWVYDGASILLMIIFLSFFKHGKFLGKCLCVIAAYALVLATTLTGVGITTLLTDATLAHIQEYQEVSRLVAIIFTKSMQAALFFVLAKRSTVSHGNRKAATILFTLITIIIFASMLIIFINNDGLNEALNAALTWISAGLLMIMIIIFVLYEMFTREEAKTLALTANLQRVELERQYAEEIDAVYAEIRKWRHEYKNHLIALQAHAAKENSTEVLDYIGALNSEAQWNENTLQTGNFVLDAVASSKLSLARSLGIEIDIHAVYPNDSEVDDKDLCSIVGNLLDNAIEACQRMTGNQKKFISFSLLAKGNHMVITISNSYEGVIERQRGRFLTKKNGKFSGMGINYVDSIIEKNEGTVTREYEYGVFSTYVLLPIKLKISNIGA